MNKSNNAFRVTGNRNAHPKQITTKLLTPIDSNLKSESGEKNALLGCRETRLNKWHNDMISLINKNQEEV